MTSNRKSIERDLRVMQLYEQLLEIEQRLIPTGLHTFGRALELREIFFQPSVRKIGQRLTAERFDDRPELAHERIPSNTCSMLPAPPR